MSSDPYVGPPIVPANLHRHDPTPSAASAASIYHNPIIERIQGTDFACLLTYMEEESVVPGAVVVEQGAADRALFFVAEGQMRLRRGGLDLGVLGPGEQFGELGLMCGHPRAATVEAETPAVLLHLRKDAWDKMCEDHPHEALRFAESLLADVGRKLTDMTDRVDLLLKERLVPRRSMVRVRMNDRLHWVKTGTPLRALLPTVVDGMPVVAGLIDYKPVPLNMQVTSDATLAPLTISHWEGRLIYRHSAALLLLEAANHINPSMELVIGPSIGFAQIVWVPGASHEELDTLAPKLEAAMRDLAHLDTPFRVEHWSVEEATSHFRERGWDEAAHLLQTQRSTYVPLVSCGFVYAIGMGPTLPSALPIHGFHVERRGDSLLLYHGDEMPGPRPEEPVSPRPSGDITLGDRRMANSHLEWLEKMGVDSVGAFNEFCISGKVAHIIRISEGFQEKQLGAIADAVASREGVRVVCVAGPSSSGKTTFLKRLTIQLSINGLNPIGISLDDYYVDRDKTVKDEHGEYDFEAIEALNLELLQDHLHRLLAGEKVRTAKYDFQTGKSDPSGGPELTFGPKDILMLEGIHGLNPRLVGSAIPPEAIYRIFLNPMTALPFDRLSRVNVSDVRLLRRIVRDRHQRGHGAADSIARWPSVRRGERNHIFPFLPHADVVFDSALIYELSVLKVFADRYLLEVPQHHPAYVTAFRLRNLIDRFVTIYPDHVPPTSLLREFIGGSGFEY